MVKLISRPAVISLLERKLASFNKVQRQVVQDTFSELLTRIESLPYVNSPAEWTPISIDRPKSDGYYLTTSMYMGVYCDYWSEDHFDRTETVIAWMPLPVPYGKTIECRKVTKDELANKMQEITAMRKVILLEKYLEKYEDSDAVKCKYIRQILDPKAYGLEEEEE